MNIGERKYTGCFQKSDIIYEEYSILVIEHIYLN